MEGNIKEVEDLKAEIRLLLQLTCIGGK